MVCNLLLVKPELDWISVDTTDSLELHSRRRRIKANDSEQAAFAAAMLRCSNFATELGRANYKVERLELALILSYAQ